MTEAQTGTVVLKDATGSYFLVSEATLEQGRIPEEKNSEFERFIAAAADDVRGHHPGLIVIGAGVGIGAWELGSWLGGKILEGSGGGDGGVAALGKQWAAEGKRLSGLSKP